MRILIATALYPPDTAEPAPYAKELAGRLADQHSVSVLLYGRLPEHVQNVTCTCVDKRLSRIARIAAFTTSLFRLSNDVDIVHVENGPSVEVPVLIWSLCTQRPYVLHVGDSAAHTRAQSRTVLRYLEKLTQRRALRVVHTAPIPKPEILPFAPRPEAELEHYEEWWLQHLAELEDLYTYDAK
jgi:hypothetical protein